MRNWGVALVGVLVFVASFLLPPGCSSSDRDSTFTLYNQLTGNRKVIEVSLSRYTGSGLNILPEPLLGGQSFTVRDLPRGDYRISVRYERLDGGYAQSIRSQYMEGGRHYEWFFVGDNVYKTGNDGAIVVSDPDPDLAPQPGFGVIFEQLRELFWWPEL